MKKLIILICCFFFSCRSDNKLESQIKYDDFVNRFFKDYESTYNDIYSWLEESKKKNLENTREIIFNKDFKVDELLIMNNEKNKLVGTVNILNSNWKNSEHDWIFNFWGVKIDNEWHFSRGGSLFVPRENYKYNIYEPLTHYQLSHIGRDYFLKHFLNMSEGKISVNSESVTNHVSLKKSMRFKNEDRDQNWKDYFTNAKSKVVSQKEIDDIWESINNDVKVEEALPKKGTKEFKELYGDKVPLFEREEWKTYEAKMKKDQN